jgi:hypothetical protein
MVIIAPDKFYYQFAEYRMNVTKSVDERGK